MKKTLKIFSALLCVTMFASSLFACGKKDEGGVKYPDFPLTEDNGTPSWEQGEKIRPHNRLVCRPFVVLLGGSCRQRRYG